VCAPLILGEDAMRLAVRSPAVLGEGGRGEQEGSDDYRDQAFHESPFGWRVGSGMCGVHVLLDRARGHSDRGRRHTLSYRHRSPGMASGISLGMASSSDRKGWWTMAMTTDEKVRENRLRRMAERRGLSVHKSRRRDPGALDYGHIWLERWAVQDGLDASSSDEVWAGPFRSLDELEAYFAGRFSPEREFGRDGVSGR
jgi:hypothetical protein